MMRGATLVEILVALAVASLAITSALTAFGHARGSFAAAEDRLQGQQSLRAAMEWIVGDLELAGSGLFLNEAGELVDDAIELALPAAIVFRGDLDGGDVERAADPEETLGGDAVGAVAIGNDEIVGYVLGRPAGGEPEELVFSADVASVPRDGSVEPVTVRDVALDAELAASDPLTLYRLTLHNDAARYGSRGFVVRTPVASDVTALRFRYFDRFGRPLSVGTVAGEETATARHVRRSIRRIGVELEGVLEHDRSRRLTVSAEVAPANLALAPLRSAR